MELLKLKTLLDYLKIKKLKQIYSNLGKEETSNDKYTLVNKLHREIIYNNILNQIICCLDDVSLDIINEIASKGYLIRDNNDTLINYYDALSDYGLLFKITEDGIVYYTIAREINEIIIKNKDKFQKQIELNRLILKFAKAAVSYYGLLDKDEIIELYHYYHRYSNVDIFPRLQFYSQLQSVFSYNGTYLFDNNVRDIEGFVRDKEHFKNLPLYKYTQDQFYVNEKFISIDTDAEFYFELSDYFINEINCDASIIVAIYYYLMYEYDIDHLIEVIDQETIVDVKRFDRRFEQYIKKLYQSVRCWVLKGHKVSEVNEMIEENPEIYIKSDFVLLKKPEVNFKRRSLFNRYN